MKHLFKHNLYYIVRLIFFLKNPSLDNSAGFFVRWCVLEIETSQRHILNRSL